MTWILLTGLVLIFVWGTLTFNRTVPLRDTWAKIEKAQQDG